MIIRELGPRDSVAALTALLHAAYAALGAAGFNYTAVDQSEAVTARRIARGTCLVALADDALVGTAMFHAPGQAHGCAWYEQPGVAVVGQFGVLPARQGDGIGRALLREAERRARAAGATELALDIAEGANHLIDWYKKDGFRFVEYAQWAGKHYRSVIMTKRLGGQSTAPPY